MFASKKEAKFIHADPAVSGRPDGVETMTNCVINRFEVDSRGRPAGLKEFPELHECRMLASRSNGTVSLSIHGLGEMVTIQLEDLRSLLRAADIVSAEKTLL